MFSIDFFVDHKENYRGVIARESKPFWNVPFKPEIQRRGRRELRKCDSTGASHSEVLQRNVFVLYPQPIVPRLVPYYTCTALAPTRDSRLARVEYGCERASGCQENARRRDTVIGRHGGGPGESRRRDGGAAPHESSSRGSRGARVGQRKWDENATRREKCG